MPASDFFEWMIYEQIEPFGDRRGDIQAGIQASTFANIHRSDKTKPYKLTDFIPDWEPRPPAPQSAEDQLQMMLTIQAIQNAKVNGSA